AGLIALRRATLPSARDAQTFLRIAESELGRDVSDFYRDSLGQVVADYADHFASLKPTTGEIRTAKGIVNTINNAIAIMRATLPHAKTAAEFADIVQPDIRDPNDNYKKRINEVIRDH